MPYMWQIGSIHEDLVVPWNAVSLQLLWGSACYSENLWIGISTLMASWPLKGWADSLSETVMLIVGFVVAALIISRLSLRPQKT